MLFRDNGLRDKLHPLGAGDAEGIYRDKGRSREAVSGAAPFLRRPLQQQGYMDLSWSLFFSTINSSSEIYRPDSEEVK